MAAAKTAEKKKVNAGTIEIPTYEARDRKVESIPVDRIVPSTFETQERRRARFTEAEDAELAEDIRINGLVHPILVRPIERIQKRKTSGFEIVVGERRWRAVKRLKHTKIDATVESLTDAEAFARQQSENKQRKAQHPVDEAFAYKLMGETFGYDDAEIAAREGKSIAYIHSRRELLKLPPAVLTAFEKNSILLGHAVEIAKYREGWQESILNLCFSVDGWGAQSLVSVPTLINRIKERFLHRLDAAPFPINNTSLRSDGLTCKECPDRTGVRATLFNKDEYGKQDQCLDPECWSNKTHAFIEIGRIEIATKAAFKPDEPVTEEQREVINAVPLVLAEYIRGEQPKGDVILGYNYGTTLLKSADECENTETGIYYNGENIGKPAYFCRAQRCPKHAGKFRQDVNKAPGERSDDLRRRKEELIDVRVGNEVRKQVFKQAAEKFAETFTISEVIDADLLANTIAWMRKQCDGMHKDLVVYPILDEWAGKSVPRYTYGGKDGELKFLKEHFDGNFQKRMYFLFLHAEKGAMYAERYVSQQDVLALAASYGIDYQLIDAEQRLVYAMEKLKRHVEHFRQYLEAVKEGKRDTPVPRVFKEDYRPKS